MADNPQTPPATTTETTPAAPPNTPESRNPDGSLKNLLDSKPELTSKPEGEAKPNGEKPAEGEKKDDAGKVPDKYEPFKAPEGMELQPEAIAKFEPVAKELGLTQDQAQKLVDFYGETIKANAGDPQKAWNDLNATWRKDTIADREIGNGTDGLKPEVAQRINAAIDSMPEAVRTPFKEAMNLTGAGNNPAFIRAFDFLASKLPREGSLVTGRGASPAGQVAPGSGPKSAAQAIFPNLPSAR